MSTREKIYKFIQENPMASQKDIARSLAISKQTVSYHVIKLVEENRIFPGNIGQEQGYAIPEKPDQKGE